MGARALGMAKVNAPMTSPHASARAAGSAAMTSPPSAALPSQKRRGSRTAPTARDICDCTAHTASRSPGYGWQPASHTRRSLSAAKDAARSARHCRSRSAWRACTARSAAAAALADGSSSGAMRKPAAFAAAAARAASPCSGAVAASCSASAWLTAAMRAHDGGGWSSRRPASGARPSDASAADLGAASATSEGKCSCSAGISKALMMARPSKRSGWLHTLRSCMSTLSTPMKLPPCMATLTSAREMKSSYSSRWRLDMRHMMTCSTLGGRLFSTSFFRRRSRKGRRMACNRPTIFLLAAARAAASSALPSTADCTGCENHWRNSACERNTCGMRKCMSDHSSIRSFCRGVPVSSRRRAALKLSSVCQRCERQFLIMWASSRMR
mmetsp:Transcript_16966/g.52600  ORF Transcript_16966/g.52600 Transcript_16966/m.52600 type:complete len:384 (-) Transcript_16966:2183-3334(-)